MKDKCEESRKGKLGYEMLGNGKKVKVGHGVREGEGFRER